MPDKTMYTAQAVSSGDGRNGHVTSSDKLLDLDLAMPPELGGSGQGTNPEQLFACGYAACFHSALKLVAGRTGASADGSSVTADVGIGPEGEGFGLEVTLTVAIPGADRAQAQQLIDSAHQVCPYSRATRGNITVDLRLA